MLNVSLVVRLSLALLIASLFLTNAHTEEKKDLKASSKTRLYIGTYTGGESQGIYQAELDPTTGQLELIGLAAEAKNPTFLALHPSHDYLYAVSEVDDYDASKGGALSAFKIDADSGKLTLLNHQSSAGAGPCHVSLDRGGKHALVANYGGGSAAVLPIDGDGKLGPATATVQHEGSSVNKERQEGPHAHSINLAADNRFAFVADLGLDQMLVYKFDPAAGTLTPNQPPAFSTALGAGPRHFAFHPSGKWAYVNNELDSTVTALRYDAKRGVLEKIETFSTLPADAKVDNTTAEVLVHPSGQFLYCSNRGHHSIAMFAIDQESGGLTSLGQHPVGGETPRNFNIDPTGKFLLSAQQDSNSIVVHAIDPTTGKLTRTAHEIAVPKPVCVKFVP